MPKQNPYIIPIENKKPFATVYELKKEYEIPTYEEFMKTYEGDVNYDDLWDNDISVDRSYGPGNSQSNQVASTIGGFVLSITWFTPLAPITIPFTVTSAVVGGAAEIIGHVADDENMREAGGFFRNLGVTGTLRGVSNGVLDNRMLSNASMIERGVYEVIRESSGHLSDKINEIETQKKFEKKQE